MDELRDSCQDSGRMMPKPFFGDILPKPYDWHKCMLEMAFTISKMSKDPSTKIGAVLVSPSKNVVSFGYNGFPKNVPDRELWWTNRNGDSKEFSKYELVAHAEENVIDNINIADLTDFSLYITHQPCLSCAKRIVKKGIRHVYYVYGNDKLNMDLQTNKVNKLFDICNIGLTQIDIEEIQTTKK